VKVEGIINVLRLPHPFLPLGPAQKRLRNDDGTILLEQL